MLILKLNSSAAAAPINASSDVAWTENDIWRSTIRGAITPDSTPSNAAAMSDCWTKSTPSKYWVSEKNDDVFIYTTTNRSPTRTTSTFAP